MEGVACYYFICILMFWWGGFFLGQSWAGEGRGTDICYFISYPAYLQHIDNFIQLYLDSCSAH